MLTSLVLHAAETAEHGEAVNHWVIGTITIAILLGLLGILLAFAGGREHS
jgi:hypothetical protein